MSAGSSSGKAARTAGLLASAVVALLILGCGAGLGLWLFANDLFGVVKGLFWLVLLAWAFPKLKALLKADKKKPVEVAPQVYRGERPLVDDEEGLS
jgi:hypothetical protein